MSLLNISKLKYTWKGPWTSGMRYYKNDVTQWNGSSYVCIQDIPDEFKLAVNTEINNTVMAMPTPEIVFVDRRPDNASYWKLIVRGNTFKHGWMPHRTYQLGDIVKYGGDLFMYTGAPGIGATGTAAVGNGQITSISIIAGGQGYTVAPTVTIMPANANLWTGVGAQAFARVIGGIVTSVVITSAGTGYSEPPVIVFGMPMVRNTHPDDTNYWTKVFENPNYDTRRMYAVATPNMQPLGWTQNYGDYTNPQTNDGWSVGFIDALGVPYSVGNQGQSGSYNVNGAGRTTWRTTWQPAGFSFIDWLRSTDNRTSLGIVGLTNIGLPTPDGKPPRCIQWIKTSYYSIWLFNNGEVYTSGYNVTGQSGTNVASGTNLTYPQRCTNQSNLGYLNETLPKTFNQTKIIKVDSSNVGSNASGNASSYALGEDGSMWSWGYNAYGQLGHGQVVPGTVASGAGSAFNNQIIPVRIPAQYFDYAKIVDFMCFGNEVTSVLAIDENGDLWGWGANYYGELGLGGSTVAANVVTIPTKISFDFKRFGGIKKMSYYHYAAADVRAAYILTNDGSLFGAGYFKGATSPLGQNAIADTAVTQWTKFINTTVNVKSIENFWVVGDRAYNIYIREKDTGLTYAMGDNANLTLGSGAPTTYWWNSGGLTGGWSLVKGPKNLVHVTNNSANTATDASYSWQTIVLLEESGRLWGQGSNFSGSLSIGARAEVNEPAAQNPETGAANYFQPIKVPAGAKFGTMMGQGTATTGQAFYGDIGSYITNDGQILYCGTDYPAVNRVGAAPGTSSGVSGIQGSAIGYWSQTTINVAATNQYANDRYTMHSQLGD